jgi:hypothetical protein
MWITEARCHTAADSDTSIGDPRRIGRRNIAALCRLAKPAILLCRRPEGRRVRVRKRHGPAWRDAREGSCPPGGSGESHASYVSSPAGRPSSTAATTACRAVRASPIPWWMTAGQAFGQASVAWVDAERHNRTDQNGEDMSEQIRPQERGLISIHVRDAAEVSAMIREMTATVARLRRESEEMREELVELRAVRRSRLGPSVLRSPGGSLGCPH